MNVVIVDDEHLAIEELKFQLSLFDDIHVVKTFQNPDEAFDYLTNTPVDLVFLDIQMPGKNGLNLARMLKSATDLQIIFVTAYTDYAVHSYDLDAVDYLLKPINTTRLMKALDKVKINRSNINNKKLQKDFILIYDHDVLKPIKYDEIAYCRANDKNVEIFTRTNKFIFENSIGKLEELLNQPCFFRCHRSYIINLKHINLIEPIERSYLIKLNGFDELIPISRSNVMEFKRIMAI